MTDDPRGQLHDFRRPPAVPLTGQHAAPADPAFDPLTRLAVRLLAAPVALLLWVTADQQCLASVAGSAALPPDRSLPLAGTLAGRVVASAAPLAVHNTASDAAVRADPLVRVFGFAALAGVPIPGAGRPVLGILWAGDTRPRTWTPADLAVLADLAGLAAPATDPGRTTGPGAGLLTTMRDLQTQEQRFRRLAENAHDLIYRFEFLPRPGYSYLSEAVTRLLGYPPAAFYADPEFDLQIVHPEDRRLVEDALTGRAITRQLVVRFLHRDGQVVWLDLRRVPVHDESGRLVAFEGSARDVTAEKQAEAALRESEQNYRRLFAAAQRQAQELALLDRVRTALLSPLDLPALFRTVVEAIAETFGYTQVSLYLLQGTQLVIQHQVGYEWWFERIALGEGIIGRVAQSGQPVLVEDVQSEAAYRAAHPGVVSELCVPLFEQSRVAGILNVESINGVALGAADLRLMQALSEHVHLALARARLYTEVRENATALRRQNAELDALQATTLALIDQLDLSSLLEAILTRAAGLVNTPDGYLSVREPETGDLVIRVGLGVFAAEIGYRQAPGAGLAGHVVQTGALVNVADYNTWPGHRPDLERLGLSAVCGIPLRAGAEVVGVLGLAHREPARPFDAAEVALLGRFGELASLALANARLYTTARQELDQRKRAEERLAHLALHDSLTGLPNRVLLRDHLQAAIRALDPRNPTLALLLMDLDRFKEVNDTLGHSVGDALLAQVGERLRGALRGSDTVARLGGDEFAAVLPGVEARTAARIARKLVKALAEPFVLESHNLAVRISIGIALCPEHGADPDTLLRHADVAMYMAKRGGGGLALYAAETDPYSPRRLALVADLRQAIDDDRLVLYYQPKLRAGTGQPAGVEGLVRWPHPDRGLLGPDSFIALAEETGLLPGLRQRVVATALHAWRAWEAQGLALPVAVNLSMRDLRDRHLPEAIAQLLATTGVPAEQLRIEIPERAAMADIGRTLAVLSQLRMLGVRLAIDDFGTAHSSLAHLRRLPVDQIKIDRSFVHDMLRHENDRVIVRSTIDLGHMLGLEVVAEGVEDAATWAQLTAWGCDEGQGFYLGPPLPAPDLPDWLRRGEATAGPAPPV